LAQYAPPAELLARPADDFVASFVGRDRGYRGLSFADSMGIELTDVPTVVLGDVAASTSDSAHGWILVLDASRRPRGWLPSGAAADGGSITEGELAPGGSLYTLGTPLRGALDAALSAPSGLGVAVDREGRYAGVVTAQHVLHLIAKRWRES
jgi:osmoprotectant transport system ATP-binding protein